MRCAILLAAQAVMAAVAVTPIEKVIDLIEGMKKEVEGDGTAEAKAYDEFACFCKNENEARSTSIKKETDNINEMSANIADETARKEDDIAELAKRKGNQEALSRNLDETVARCAKQRAEYNAEAADLSKAIQGLEDAIKAMTDSKPSAAAFISLKQSLGKTLAMAEAMNLLQVPKHRAVAAFLQQTAAVDPKNPEYSFHSDDIIEVCQSLLKDYKANKKELDEEWERRTKDAPK